MFQNVAVQWLIRRVPDWGGWIGTFAMTLYGIYVALPPRAQDAMEQAFSGNWEQITLGSLVPIAAVIYAQIISFRATTKPKEVAKVEGAAIEVSAPRKSLWDILKGK